MEEKQRSKRSVRERADAIKEFRCKNLIAVLENPTDVQNIGTVIRNVNALGVEKVYVVDPRRSLPDDWQKLRDEKRVSKTSVSAVKWTFVRRFDSTDEEGWSSILLIHEPSATILEFQQHDANDGSTFDPRRTGLYQA